MKNPIRLSLCLIIMALPQVVLADSVPATVSTIKGSVTVKDASGNTVPVTQGSKIPVGDTITTGGDGTVGLILVPGAATVVEPNSSVKISSLDFNKGADGSNNRKIMLNLKNGSLISKLFKKDGHSDFQVATPYGVAAAKGTSWAVVINGTSFAVEVVDGNVTVSTPGGKATFSVGPGQGYDSTTGTVTSLPQSVIDSLTSQLSTALPGFTQAQALQILNQTINPSTVVNQDQINSPNGK